MVTVIKKGTPPEQIRKLVAEASEKNVAKKPHVTDFFGKIKTGIDPVEYQRKLRDEW